MSTSATARTWWRQPRLRRGDDRSVGWLELFFDLVFVVVVSRLAHDLGGDVSVRGVLEFGLQFFGVFWVWNAFTYYTERFEGGGIEDRLFTFVALLPVSALAVYAEGGLAEHYEAFVWSYLGARAVNMLGWIRAARSEPAFRPITARFVTGAAVAAALLLVSFAAGPDLRLALWTLAVLVDIATPASTVALQSALPPISASKFPERFGLFTLIVLGESIIGVITGVSELSEAGELTGVSALSAGLGLAVGFSLWWVYFDFIARRPPRPSFSVSLGWVYLHLGAVTAITVSGVGLSAVIADAAHGGLTLASQRLLTGGVGVGLVALGALETTLERNDDEPTHAVTSPTMKVAAGALLLLLGFGPFDWSTIPLLGVVLAALAAQALYGSWVWFTKGEGATAPSEREDAPAS